MLEQGVTEPISTVSKLERIVVQFLECGKQSEQIVFFTKLDRLRWLSSDLMNFSDAASTNYVSRDLNYIFKSMKTLVGITIFVLAKIIRKFSNKCTIYSIFGDITLDQKTEGV